MARTIGSHGPKTMEAIRKAGLRLIFEHGYAAMSLRQLAAEVGIQSGSLYNHISTKQELLFELVRDHINELLRQLDRALLGKQQPADRLRAFVAFHVSYHMTKKREVFIANSELRSLEPKNYDAIVTLREGAAWLQPPRIEHRVLDYSDDCELLEIVVPANFKTVELE